MPDAQARWRDSISILDGDVLRHTNQRISPAPRRWCAVLSTILSGSRTTTTGERPGAQRLCHGARHDPRLTFCHSTSATLAGIPLTALVCTRQAGAARTNGA